MKKVVYLLKTPFIMHRKTFEIKRLDAYQLNGVTISQLDLKKRHFCTTGFSQKSRLTLFLPA